MKRVVTLIGARPQFVKAAVVSKALRASDQLVEKLIHSGQHYDSAMSEVFFKELSIPEPYGHLEVGSAPHGEQTGRILAEFEKVLVQESPDWVLVYGDTNTTLAGAIAAAKLHIPVAHIEAGLRSFNRRMPEEINRIVADSVSDLLFAPTDTAVAHLRKEGVSEDRIHLVGDVMFDVVRIFGNLATEQSSILQRHALNGLRYTLATIHRAENTDDETRLKAIVKALGAIAAESMVVLPLHPRTKASLAGKGLLAELEKHARVIPPVGYLDMLVLERHAALILTDSGGVQKEAYFHGVPCVTIRSETEWVELVDTGWNRLADPESYEEIVDAATAAIGTRGSDQNLYGDGHAAEKIVGILESS
ncbi:MAG: non-hydrolyzing UDP-N-acetylglucosamine 2-epimerase [Pseudomonadales bacterium]